MGNIAHIFQKNIMVNSLKLYISGVLLKREKMYYTKKFYDLFIIKVSLLPYQTFFAVVFQAILTKLISVQYMSQIKFWSLFLFLEQKLYSKFYFIAKFHFST